MNFLDKTGLTYFWSKIKDYITSKKYVDSPDESIKHIVELTYDEYQALETIDPDILDYLGVMMGNPMFNPNNNYLDSCISFVISLAEIYNKYILKKINDYTLQRIFTLANDSNDENVIHLKDYLQNLIFTIRMQS